MADRRRWWAVAQSWVVALVPPATLGLATSLAAGYAAVRMRSWRVGLAAAGYAVSEAAFVLSGAEDGPWVGQAIVIGGVVGTAHLLYIRPRLARALAARPVPALADDPDYRAALRRRQRRDEVRALLASDPAIAAELRIGRPDLPRSFDDGGLVDVNRVPASVLAALPGFDEATAARVVAVRDARGGLLTIDDLVVFADVPAEVVAACRDRLLVA